MKIYCVCFVVSIFLVGCSAGPTIPTAHYEDELVKRCISNIPEELRDDPDKKTDCAMSAIFNVRLATRIYETMAEEQKLECDQTYVEAEKSDTCYKEKQKKFFDDWISNLPSS